MITSTAEQIGYWKLLLPLTWIVPVLIGCDRAPREPEPPQSVASYSSGGITSGEATAGGGTPDAPEAPEACIVPLVDPPPPEASSVESCPDDPGGRPTMPLGSVSFPEASEAPTLRVELALNNTDRNHGLMYRPELTDNEGMLFTWDDEAPRSFWMKNTCLALDMLFIAKDGTVAGILEQVPPMNETSRRVDCPAAHVLEVPAGWTRKYGVKPGQKMSITESL